MPGIAGWLGAAGCGFPTISTCEVTEILKTGKKIQGTNGIKKEKASSSTCVPGVVATVVIRGVCV